MRPRRPVARFDDRIDCGHGAGGTTAIRISRCGESGPSVFPSLAGCSERLLYCQSLSYHPLLIYALLHAISVEVICRSGYLNRFDLPTYLNF
ncbi:hypothetical protein VTN96DRAFT_836 [Rasamsonia emersonii]